MNKYTRMNWENTPSTATPLTADNLNHMDEGIERATDGAIALESEITTARGSQSSLGVRLDKIDKSIARKLDSKPFDSEPKNNSPCYLTSGAVYNALQAKANVNSVYSKTETDNSLQEKADKADVARLKDDLAESYKPVSDLDNRQPPYFHILSI